MNRLRWLVALLVGVAAGCGGSPTCNEDAPYQFAREEPPIRIPEGLDPPDTESALVIPPITEGESERPPGLPPCLEQPPSYYPERPRPEV